MKVDMNVVRVLVERQYRLVACNNEMMVFVKDDNEAVLMNEKTITFSKDRNNFVELNLDRLSWNGDQTCVYDVAKRWGWELGVGKRRNNYIA